MLESGSPKIPEKRPMTTSAMLDDLQERIRLLGDHEQYDIKNLALSVVRETRGAARDGEEILRRGHDLLNALLEIAADKAELLDREPGVDHTESNIEALKELHITKQRDLILYAPVVENIRKRKIALAAEAGAQNERTAREALRKRAFDLHQPAGLVRPTRTWRRKDTSEDAA